MKNLFLFVFIISIGFLSSCEDFFESTIELDAPVPENFLFVSTTIDLEDERIYASITRTVSVADISNPFGNSILTDADVRISKDNSGVELSLEYDPLAQSPVHYISNIPMGFYEEGESYTFSAEHSDYPRAYVTEVFPRKVELNGISFEEEGGVNEEGNERSRVTINFQDPPGKQYYEVIVFESTGNVSNNTFRSTFSDSTDPSVRRGAVENSVIIEDGLFDGEQKSIDLRVYRHTEERAKERLWVSFKTVTESYYNFSKTKFARDEFGDENPFQSPVQLFSNVNDGLGIVGFTVEDFRKY